MKYALLPILLLSNYISPCQTCVIAKKTKDAIYIGADSRVSTTRTVKGKTIQDTSSIRKIFWCGNIGYAVIGSFGVDAINYLSSHCKKESNAISIETAYRNFGYKLRNTLLDKREKESKWFDNYIKEWGKAISQLVIFGRDADSLFMYRILFYYDPIIKDLKYQSSVRTNLLYAGDIDEIKDTLETKTVWAKGVVKTIKFLINTAARYHPLRVGGKTDILRITMKEFEWL